MQRRPEIGRGRSISTEKPPKKSFQKAKQDPRDDSTASELLSKYVSKIGTVQIVIQIRIEHCFDGPEESSPPSSEIEEEIVSKPPENIQHPYQDVPWNLNRARQRSQDLRDFLDDPRFRAPPDQCN